MTLLQDLRHAWRILRRDRATSAVIVFTLALGIAATSTMFGVVDQLLLRAPAGIGDADRVRRLYFGTEAKPQRAPNQSFPVLKTIAEGVSAFSETAALHRADVTIGSGEGARQRSLELVTSSYFRLLRLTPAAGRFFGSAEDRGADADPVLVLSHAFWQLEFAGDPAAVGRDLMVEGKRFTIVGVTPRGFSGPRRDRVDLWAPPGALGRELLGDDWATTTNWYRFELIARLSPGVPDTQANAQVTAVYRRAIDPVGMSGANTPIAFGASLNGLGRPGGIAFQARVGLWLLGVAAVVVLIACANVAGLQLARTIARRREIAVRVAIGASRGRLLRMLLTESALLSTVAGVAALFLTYLGGRLVQQLLLPGATWDDSVIDGRVLAATFAISTLTALATGMGPSVHAWSTDVAGAMRPAQGVTRGRTGVLRAGLLVTQVTLCVLLLVGAGLFVKSLAAVRAYDVGIDLGRVIQASFPERLEPVTARALYGQAIERLAAIPGVQRVALNGGSLRLKSGRSMSMTPEGMTRADVKERHMDAYFVVTPGYFDTLGARIERGRDLTAEDDRLRARVAVVSSDFARRFWPGEETVGRCVSFSIAFNRATCTAIVGVVKDVVLHNRTVASQAQVFVLSSHPEFEARNSPNAVLIRTHTSAAELVPVVRQVLQSLTPDMGYVAADTLERMYAPQLQPWRLGSWMFLAFGAVALLIAAVGLYSSLAFAVSQRTKEIGIRMALGASPWKITETIGASSVATMAIGVALGLLCAALATRWLSDLLFQTSPRDPLVFATVAVVLALVGVVASVVPARRAAAVDPIVVLRDS